ncbi:MAG: heavy-metal-associated domain-containing protein, partial [Ignavibacteria bacterium]
MTINTLKLNIKGMTCEHCAKTIEKKLDQLDGIVEKSISYREKNGT